MKKEDKFIYIDATIRSETQQLEDDSKIEAIDVIENKPFELISVKPAIKTDMINIPGVTILPKKEEKKAQNNALEELGEEDPLKCISISTDIPFLFTYIKKEVKYYKGLSDFGDGLENGLTNIYSLKLVLMNNHKNRIKEIDSNDDGKRTVEVDDHNSSHQMKRYILLFGSRVLKSELYDEQGFKKGKDKISLDHIKINIEENDFHEYEKEMLNIKEYVEPIKLLTNYFHKFFDFFKKMSEKIIVNLKHVNLNSFFSYIIYQELDKKKILLANMKDLTKIIDKLTFDDCYLNIHKYAAYVETQIVNTLLTDEEINGLDINSTEFDILEILKDFSIMKDTECLESYLKEYLFIEYSSDKVKKFLTNDDSKNYLQYVLIMKLLSKVKKYFLDTYYFCCFDKSYLDDPVLKKSKGDKNFFICFSCNCIVCIRCIKYHCNHLEELLKFDSFDTDPILEKLCTGHKNIFREKLEMSFRKKKGYKRKYILLLDYIKIFISEYISKELLLIRGNEGFAKFIQEVLNKQEFKDVFLSYYTRKEVPMLKNLLFDRDEDKNPFFKRLQTSYFKVNFKEKSQEGLYFNRKIMEDIAVGIISQGKNSLKFISKSNLYNEFNTPYMNVYMAHRYSPKTLYRDLFLKSKKENYFLDKYIFPLINNERIKSQDLLLDDPNENIYFNILKKPSRKIESVDPKYILTSDLNNINNIDNKKLLNESRLSRISSHVREYSHNDLDLTGKSSRVRSISNRFSHRKEETDANLFEKILNQTQNIDETVKKSFPKLKIIIAFLEDFTRKVENYGIFLREDELKVDRNFD